MGSKRRGSTFTRFFEDIVDDAKGLVDDLIDRAKDVEDDARHSASDLVSDDDDDDEGDAQEAAALRRQIDELKAKLDQLTAMQKGAE